MDAARADRDGPADGQGAGQGDQLAEDVGPGDLERGGYDDVAVTFRRCAGGSALTFDPMLPLPGVFARACLAVERAIGWQRGQDRRKIRAASSFGEFPLGEACSAVSVSSDGEASDEASAWPSPAIVVSP